MDGFDLPDRRHGSRESGGPDSRWLQVTDTADLIVELAGGEPVEVAAWRSIFSRVHLGRVAFLKQPRLSLSTGRQGVHTGRSKTSSCPHPGRAGHSFSTDRSRPATLACTSKTPFEGARPKPPSVLGELKVIAKPGFDISGGKGFNLADPTLGGHVAWSTAADHCIQLGRDMLIEEENVAINRESKPGQELRMGIGFHHVRAAQITRSSGSTRPKTTDADMEVRKVALSVSLDSPVGPWRPDR